MEQYKDPLFGGLAREARQFGLPVTIFVIWLMGLIPIAVVFMWFIKGVWGISIGVVATLSWYLFLLYLTQHDDRGVQYAIYRMKRQKSKTFGGLTHEPLYQFNKGLDFNFMESQRAERELIPYLSHATDSIVCLANGDFMSVIEFVGIEYETQSDEFLAQLKNYRAQMMLQVGNHVTFHVHYVRRELAEPIHFEQSNYFSNLFLQGYQNQLNQKKRFENKIYLTIIAHKKPLAVGVGSSFKSVAKVGFNDEELRQDLTNACTIASSQLAVATPRLLGMKYDENGLLFSETLSLASYLLNFDDTPAYLYDDLEVRDTLSHTRKVFKKQGVIEIQCASGTTRAGALFGVPTDAYPQSTSHKFIGSFLNIPNELVVSMSFTLMDRAASATLAKDQQKFLLMTDDDSISQTKAINDVRDAIASGKLLNGMFNMSVLVHSESASEYKTGVENVRKTLAETGFIPRREDMIAEPCFYGMLAGNLHLPSRSGIINSINFAGLASFHNSATGQKTGNHWQAFSANPNGDYVLEFATVSQTPYYFNFHASSADVGHTRVAAPTGGGKTTLINALITSLSNFDPFVFHFDYLHSSAVTFELLDGKHQSILPTVATDWNPLQLPDTPENRSFLFDFLSLLVSKKNDDGKVIVPTSKESSELHKIINAIYEQSPELRQLKHVKSLFGVVDDDNLAERIKKWCEGGAYGSIFDNATDNFSVEGAKLFCFEMKHIIEKYELFQAVIMYIAHRIDMAMTSGKPFVLVFEEGQRLIENPIMKSWLKTLLETVRRRNGMVIFITPNPEVLIEDSVLRQQFRTSIIFPNAQASASTYCGEGGLGLTAKEFDFVKTTDPKTRRFLIKNDTTSIITDLRLSNQMMNFVHVFSGTEIKYEFIKNLRAQGESTQSIIQQFFKRFGESK